MKIAISANSNSFDSPVDVRFGRAAGFIIYDTKTSQFNFVENTQNLEAAQGAGIQAAQNVLEHQVEAVITGNCGPKAFKVLNSAGAKIYTVSSDLTIAKAVEKFNNSELEESKDANVEGHWM